MENNNKAFAIYDETAKSLTFHTNNLIPNDGDIYTYIDDDGDLVKKQVTEVYKDIENLVYEDYWDLPWEHYKTKIVYVEAVDKISPINTSWWFYDFNNCEAFKLNKLDTSNVINMYRMFDAAGYNAHTFFLNLTNWNTSKVDDVSCMFSHSGYNAKYKLDLSSWDVSNATFYCYFNDGVENKVIAPTLNNNIKNNG